ncbi:hypothetical protein SAMN05444483_10114 [Salegentibacter echinorum]|uniref:Uncharacterized protein n=1 Tax=Salegentibacter echinorum TaxID=1073325 RepID=A0A1M5BFX3_SALEC|nr:hypothetical protein SAMN05444483_10114 [Salegentibacter echinorum]
MKYSNHQTIDNLTLIIFHIPEMKQNKYYERFLKL